MTTARHTTIAAHFGVSCCFLLVLITSSVRFIHFVEADEVVNGTTTNVLPQVAANQVAVTPTVSDVQGEATKRRTACFIEAVGRGVGTPLDSCPNGTEKDGLLCYPRCRDGYDGVGPVCWQSCPSDFTDMGVFCIHTYGKGCCCTVFGCCGCRDGNYTDDGCFCRKSFTKRTHGRGAGKPLVCGPGKERNGALCYKSCPSGYRGVGPVCWGANSPDMFPVKCNSVVWAADERTCSVVTEQIAIAGDSSAACIGMIFAASVTSVLWQLAQVVCGATNPPAITAVDNIIKLTGAKTCPS